jgi:predicted phosphodiesterase
MKILVIPDTQVKPGSNLEHLQWAGQYAVDKKPDVIVHLGDHWDMPSLSSYDVGKKSFEGRRYTDDVAAGIDGMVDFLAPIKVEQSRRRRHKKKAWNPRLIYCMGNHEERINKAINSDRKLEGLISFNDLMLEDFGWEVYPFLQPVNVGGVMFCHYFCSGVMGRPVSSARLMLTKKHQSCIMGHVQDRDIAFAQRADGKRMTGIFAGIFYQHDEEYLNHQTNQSWRGVWMLHEVADGAFDEMLVSLEYLKKKYGDV